jgi:hypothetical protein
MDRTENEKMSGTYRQQDDLIREVGGYTEDLMTFITLQFPLGSRWHRQADKKPQNTWTNIKVIS